MKKLIHNLASFNFFERQSIPPEMRGLLISLYNDPNEWEESHDPLHEYAPREILSWHLKNSKVGVEIYGYFDIEDDGSFHYVINTIHGIEKNWEWDHNISDYYESVFRKYPTMFFREVLEHYNSRRPEFESQRKAELDKAANAKSYFSRKFKYYTQEFTDFDA